MTINDVLHWVGVGALLFYAAASVVKPKFVAQILEHSVNSGRGISEFRVAHGGFFLGLAVFALYINHPIVYQTLGWSWLSAATIRLLAYFSDRPARTISIISFVAEMLLGIILLVSSFS